MKVKHNLCNYKRTWTRGLKLVSIIFLCFIKRKHLKNCRNLLFISIKMLSWFLRYSNFSSLSFFFFYTFWFPYHSKIITWLQSRLHFTISLTHSTLTKWKKRMELLPIPSYLNFPPFLTILVFSLLIIILVFLTFTFTWFDRDTPFQGSSFK